MAPRSPELAKIVIGIDFGTTFSGVAWAHSGTPDVIDFVTDWESAFNRNGDTAKTPTKLYLDANNEVVNWGYGTAGSTKAVCWFKLLLLDDSDVPSHVAASAHFSELKAAQRRTGKTPVEFVGDYLRQLWKHAIDAIKRAEGAQVVKNCDLRVMITVPADWKPYTHDRVRQAARLAKIHDPVDCRKVTIGLLSEPEAAALATLRDMGKKTTVEVGDNIVICDAGGGTVDLISYTVAGTEPFCVSECVRGIGGLCGGIFLDEQFLKSVQKKLGNKSCIPKDLATNGMFMEREWESGAKTAFRNESGTSWLVEVPSSSTGGGKRTRSLEFSQQEMFDIFDPIFRQIEGLVLEQVNAIRHFKSVEPKYVVLVGGLGRNVYLYRRLEACVDSKTTVLQSTSTRPWTAICRGAVIHGLAAENLSTELAIKVEARIARMSCGVAFQTTWKEGKFRPEDKVWCEDWYAWRASRQVNWFLKMGDHMESKSPVSKPFCGLLGMEDQVVENIFSCSFDPEPSQRQDHTVQRLCTIKWHTRDLEDPIPLWTNAVGEVFRRVDYDIRMTIDGGTVEFSVHVGDQEVGSQHVSVDFS
ncbi:actin-like ATPase domain-containing protein [Sarocladium strictum]